MTLQNKADEVKDSPPTSAPKRFNLSGQWRKLITPILFFVLVLILLWLWGPWVFELLRDENRLAQTIESMGWYGPLALIALNALQIVVAPVPAYFIQLAAGYLFGVFWGGLWASCGLLLGAMLAMFLSRRFGRPLAAWLIGEERLAHWESATSSTHPIVWFLILLAPIGDIPYYLAGLSRVSFAQIALLTLLVRAPTVFAWAAVGAGAVTLTTWQLAIILFVLGVLLVFFLRYQTRMLAWLDYVIHKRLPVKHEVL